MTIEIETKNKGQTLWLDLVAEDQEEQKQVSKEI